MLSVSISEYSYICSTHCDIKDAITLTGENSFQEVEQWGKIFFQNY